MKKFRGVTLIVAITSGLGAGIFEGAHTVGAGASGMVFGYFAYIIVRGIFDRHPIDLLIGLVMALCFAYQFTVLLPQHGIGWQDHIGGVVGGVLAGWIFRDRKRGQRAGQLTSPGSTASGDSSRAALHKELDDLGREHGRRAERSLTSSYADVLAEARMLTDGLSAAEQTAVFRATAQRVHALGPTGVA